MELTPPTRTLRLTDTCRLIPSLYPSRGILDTVASPADLPAILELRSWSDDRVSTELGVLHRIRWKNGWPAAPWRAW